MADSTTQFDHFILLLPYDQLQNPPAWVTDNFVLSAGGRHADNKTENKLILFQDGTYLELIAFINDDPEKRRGHWWDKPFGFVDWALGSSSSVDHEALRQRLEKADTGVKYGKPNDGGRTTDGKDIKWKVTFPEGVERGNVPFWCEDVTPREWRVATSEKNTTHPSGALGVAGVLLELKKDRLDRISKANAVIVDSPEQSHHRYPVIAPNKVEDTKTPSLRLQEASPDSNKDLAITLMLQTGDQKSRKGIRKSIADGFVSIDFE